VRACAAGAGHHVQEPEQLVAFVVGGVFELGVCEKRVEDAEVRVAERVGGEREIKEVADHDVDEDAQVIGVEVFVCARRGEEEVQEFEDEELQGGFTFSVEHENDVLTKGLVRRAMQGEDLDDFVC